MSCTALAKTHGYNDTELALVLADVTKALAKHKVAWLQLHLKVKAPQLRKVALIPLVTELPDIPSIVDENFETSDCCGDDHSTMHYP